MLSLQHIRAWWSVVNDARVRFEEWVAGPFEPTPAGHCRYCNEKLLSGEVRHHEECWKDSL